MGKRKEEKELILAFIKSPYCPKGMIYEEYTIPKVKEIEGKKVFVNALKGIWSFRIDLYIVGDDGNHYIVEAKTTLNTHALGQLLCYRELLAEANNIQLDKIRMLCVYKRDEPSLHKIYEKYGVKLIQIK